MLCGTLMRRVCVTPYARRNAPIKLRYTTDKFRRSAPVTQKRCKRSNIRIVPTDTETSATAPQASRRGVNLPPNFARANGLPPLKGSQLTFPDFITWWRAVDAEKRKNIAVYVYPLFPVLNFPDREHAIEVMSGTTPLGGEKGPPEEVATQAALNTWGLGDFYFQLQYQSETSRTILVKAWLKGYSDNLPGYRDWTNHPPLFIRDSKYVVLDDEKNIKSGFIQWLKKTGQLPGEVEKENSNMADTAAQTSAVGILGDIAGKMISKSLDTPAPTPAAPPVPESKPEWETIRETISTVNDIHKNNAVDPVALIDKMAHVLRHDPPPPIDLKPFVDQQAQTQAQVSHLTDKLLDMNTQRSEDLAAELRQTRETLQRVLERERAPLPPVEREPRVDPMESIIAAADKFDRLKAALGFTPPVPDEDDAPRRRRRRRDEDEDEDASKKGIAQMLLENLPTLVSSAVTLGTIVINGMHNAHVMKTGEGQTTGMPVPNTSLLPFQAPPFPSPTPTASATQPQQQLNPQPQPHGMPQQENPQMKALNFLQQITHGLLNAFEHAKTGYEYAELFIDSYGRTGEFGYEALKMAGSAPPFGDPSQGFNPLGSAKVLAQLMSMYPPIWMRIGNDPRLTDFLMQFVSYDEFLKDAEVPNLTKLCIEYEVDSVAEYLALPEDDGNDPDDNDDSPEGADIMTPNGIPMPAAGTAAAGAVPEVVAPPHKPLRKPRPQAGDKAGVN